MPPFHYHQLLDIFSNRDTLDFLLHQLLVTLFLHIGTDYRNAYFHLNNIIFLWNIGLKEHIHQDCFMCYQIYHWILHIEERVRTLPDAV